MQLVQPFASFSHLCDVVAHNSNGIIDLGLDRCGLGVSASGRVGGRATTRKIRIIGFRPVITWVKTRKGSERRGGGKSSRSDPIPVWSDEKNVHGGEGRSGDLSVPYEKATIRKEIYTRERRGCLTVTVGGGDGDGFVQRDVDDANAS